MLRNKLHKLMIRHRCGLFFSLIKEVFVLFYQYRLVRFFIRTLCTSKQPKNMIFIVGAYNSGTTIIKESLGLSTQIRTFPVEGDLLTSQLDTLEDEQWPRAGYGNKFQIENVEKEKTIFKNELLLDWAPWIDSKKFLLEKSISNSFRIKKLKAIFPKAKFIVVVRSPKGVRQGIMKRSVPGNVAAQVLGSDTYSDDFLDKQWLYLYGSIANDLEYIDSEDKHIIFYEDFLKDPADVCKSMFSFLDIDANELYFNNGLVKLNDQELAISSNATSTFELNFKQSETKFIGKDIYDRLIKNGN